MRDVEKRRRVYVMTYSGLADVLGLRDDVEIVFVEAKAAPDQIRIVVESPRFQPASAGWVDPPLAGLREMQKGEDDG